MEGKKEESGKWRKEGRKEGGKEGEEGGSKLIAMQIFEPFRGRVEGAAAAAGCA